MREKLSSCRSKVHTKEFTCIHAERPRRSAKKGFSLIELLSVIAIISLLATAAVPALSDMMASSRRTKYLTDLSTMLESARQYAVSKNTYVWVSFNEQTANGQDPLFARMFATTDGLSHTFGPEDAWSSVEVTVPASTNYAAVSRMVALGDVQLAVDADLTSTPTFAAGGTSPKLTRSIQFTPSGEAKVGAGVQGSITLSAKASYGKMAKVEDKLVINGPTGFVRIESGQAAN